MGCENISEKSWSSAFEDLRWKVDACTQFVTAGVFCGTSIQVQDFCTQSKVCELWNKVIIDKDSEAMVTLGHVYMQGFEGFEYKYSQALELFCQAANANNSEAFVALLKLLVTVEDNVAKQSEFVERVSKAAADKNPGAMFCLGVLCDRGRWGVVKNQARSRELISEAAALGSSCAMVWMGKIYANSEAEAISWCNKALAVGNKAGYCMLGEYYFKMRDTSKGLEAYQNGADLGDLGSIRHLANLFREGFLVPKDERKALELYQKAVALGDRYELFEIATLHQIAKRCKQAAAVYEKALAYEEHGSQDLKMYCLAKLYYNGGPDLPVDKQKGYRWLSRAAYLGNLAALVALMRESRTRDVGPRDVREIHRLTVMFHKTSWRQPRSEDFLIRLIF